MLKKIGVNRIIIAFDKEGKDYKEKQKYYQKLKNYCLKFSSLCKMGFYFDLGIIVIFYFIYKRVA